MIIWAIIPVKPLLQSKTRLARLLTPDQRAALTAHLLANTIQLLQQIPAIDEILVISRDDAVFTIAQAHHSRILAEKPPYQLKTAVTQASQCSAAEIVQEIVTAVHAFTGPVSQADDLTILVAKRVLP